MHRLLERLGVFWTTVLVTLAATGISCGLTSTLLVVTRGYTSALAVVISIIVPALIAPTSMSIVLRLYFQRASAEEEFRKSEATARALLDATSDSVMLLTPGLILLSINDVGARWAGRPVEELVNRPLSELFRSDVAKVRGSRFAEILAARQPLRFEDEERDRTFNHSVYPVFDSRGEIAQLAIYSRDITDQAQARAERRELERQLQKSERMKAVGTLAGGIAHNFNNLLMGVQANASVIHMDLDPSHEHMEQITNIERLVESGSKLTHQLLGYAMKGRYSIAPVNLNELVEQATSTILTTMKEIDVTCDLAAELPCVLGDQGQLEQVLLNLIINASESMPNGGRLLLFTRVEVVERPDETDDAPGSDEFIVLVVSDTGTGIPPDVIDRIFEPFYTTKGLGKNSGLGLSSSQGIIRSHSGFIEVESEPGQGTTFRIYLPGTDQLGRSTIPRADSNAPGTGTVLLVDDEEMILLGCKRMLESLGYTVIVADGGKAAIRMFLEHKNLIDVVILDMIMPGLNGGETFKQLRDLEPELKIILSSGYDRDQATDTIQDIDCDAFIQKPYNSSEIKVKIEEVKRRPHETTGSPVASRPRTATR